MRQDLRHGLRRLFRNPLFSLTVILTLAVGVGAVTTAFALVRGILSPLGYAQPEELVRIHETLESLRSSPNPRLAALWNRVPVSYLNATDWRRSSRTFRGIGLFFGTTAVVETPGEPLEVQAAQVDSELLAVLGVAPELGRWITSAEVGQQARVVLLGHDFWGSAFGADRSIVGRAVRIDGEPFTVIGVMPHGFNLPGRKDLLWTPAWPTPDDLTRRDQHAYTAIGRLAPGATFAAASEEMSRIGQSLAATYPGTNKTGGVRLQPLLDTVVGDSRHLLALLTAAAVAVLLVAGVNLTHLLLSQAVERQGETAVRIALGAGRAALVRQALAETLALAAAGCAGGLALAALARRVLPLLVATELPRLDLVRIDGRAALFAFATALAVALLGSLAPAAFSPAAALRHAFSERRSVRLLQDALVVAEVALTMTLTAGSLALVRSWHSLAAVDPGFEPRGVLVQPISLPSWRYPDDVRRGELAARLLAGLEALPGAQGAALTSRLPLPGPALVGGFRIAGQDAPGGDWTRGRSAILQFATPGYFDVLRIPWLARPAGPASGMAGSTAGSVVWINRALAEHHWPNRSPLGSEVIWSGDRKSYRIEGVFADLKNQGLADLPGELMIQPWTQSPQASFAAVIRMDGRIGDQPLRAAADVRQLLRRLDPALPIAPAAHLKDLVEDTLFGPRSRALLIGLSTGVALLLALIGTYGVMSYNAGRRRREIAIRMAAGAGRGWVLRWMLWRALRLALLGVGLGALGAVLSGRLLEGLLYGVKATDPAGLAGAALLLIAACLAAAWLPARRASRTDPATILRGL